MKVKPMRAYACPFFGLSNQSRPSNDSMTRPTAIEITSATVKAKPDLLPSPTCVFIEPCPVAEIGREAPRCILQITIPLEDRWHKRKP
jgi:hypothetical protein